VPQFNLVTRIHVLSAIREYDQLGADEFLSKYEFVPARDYVLRERGKTYDSKAILGVAHRYATGTPARSEEFSGGLDGAVKWLTDLEFTVVSLDPEGKPTARKKASTPRATKPKPPARPTKPEPVIALCPTCYTQLPATGICDYCS
jgi:hypothetical protein